MMLRNYREQLGGIPLEDAFEVVDERSGERLCYGSVEKHINAQLYPGRGLRVGIRLSDTPNELLMGALMARAMQMCRDSALNARVYVPCDPRDEYILRFLNRYGFRNDDARVSMRKALTDPKIIGQFPENCKMRSDFLESQEERAYFLERFNKLYGTGHDLEWLDKYLDRDDFVRIQAVAPDSLACEMLLWRQEDVGVVGYLQTSLRWRHRGIAREMLKYAARYFSEGGVREMAAAVHQGIPWLQRTFESAGFVQDEVLQRLPGIDFNARDALRR